MSAHHPFSPSVLGRRLLCPGSHRMELAAGERESDDSARGHRLHACMAAPRGEWETKEQGEYDLLEACWEQIDARVPCENRSVRHEVFMVLRDSEEVMSMYEDQRVVTEGTADAIAQVNGAFDAWLFDWKFGRGEVPETFLALQLQAYAAMLHQAGGYLREVHTLGYYPETGAGYEYHVQAHEVDGIVRAIKQIIAACMDPKAPLRPGAEQCKYCKAAAGCPALETRVVQIAAEPREVTPEVRAKRREARAMVEHWCEAVQEDDKAFLASGGEIPGWRTCERKGREYVSNVQSVLELVHGPLGGAEWDAVSLNLGELRRLWHVRFGGERKASDAALAELLAGHVVRSDGYQVLMRGR